MVRLLLLAVGAAVIPACSSSTAPEKPAAQAPDCSAKNNALSARWGTGEPLVASEVATLLSEWRAVYKVCPDHFNTVNSYAYLLLAFGDTTRYRAVAAVWEERNPLIPLDGPSPAR